MGLKAANFKRDYWLTLADIFSILLDGISLPKNNSHWLISREVLGDKFSKKVKPVVE